MHTSGDMYGGLVGQNKSEARLVSGSVFLRARQNRLAQHGDEP